MLNKLVFKNATQKIGNFLDANKSTISTAVFIGAFALVSQGFCVDSFDAAGAALESRGEAILSLVFSKPVKLISLAIGSGWGIASAWMSSSFKPLLMFVGLGLVPSILPPIIKLLVAV